MCVIGLQCELEEEGVLSPAEDDYDDGTDEDGKN